jgi:hypothetical protein
LGLGLGLGVEIGLGFGLGCRPSAPRRPWPRARRRAARAARRRRPAWPAAAPAGCRPATPTASFGSSSRIAAPACVLGRRRHRRLWPGLTAAPQARTGPGGAARRLGGSCRVRGAARSLERHSPRRPGLASCGAARTALSAHAGMLVRPTVGSQLELEPVVLREVPRPAAGGAHAAHACTDGVLRLLRQGGSGEHLRRRERPSVAALKQDAAAVGGGERGTRKADVVKRRNGAPVLHLQPDGDLRVTSQVLLTVGENVLPVAIVHRSEPALRSFEHAFTRSFG